MTQLKMLSADDKLAEIRRLYFGARKHSIEQDLAKALDLLKSMSTEDERERATVYMEGLAEMRNDWVRERAPKAGGTRKPAGAGKPGTPPRAGKPGGAGAKKKTGTSRAAATVAPKKPRKPRTP